MTKKLLSKNSRQLLLLVVVAVIVYIIIKRAPIQEQAAGGGCNQTMVDGWRISNNTCILELIKVPCSKTEHPCFEGGDCFYNESSCLAQLSFEQNITYNETLNETYEISGNETYINETNTTVAPASGGGGGGSFVVAKPATKTTEIEKTEISTTERIIVIGVSVLLLFMIIYKLGSSKRNRRR